MGMPRTVRRQVSTPLRHSSQVGLVFLHSLPRVGSTWLGYKFDDQPEVSYRFEPFHENLIAGTPAGLQSAFEKLRYGRSLRHPVRPQHYHKDYSFQPGGGVPLFQKRFCYQNYYMHPDQLDDQLTAYLVSQMTEASSGNRIVCMKCTKSALRAEWLARNFRGIHVYIFRSPRLIDNSHFSYRGFSNRYIRDYALIIGQNGRHPVFAELARWSELGSFISATPEEEYAHYRKVLNRGRKAKYDRQYHFDSLYFFWAVALGLATRYCNLMIDMDVLADDDIRRDITARVRDLTGLTIDLSDYHFDESRNRRILERHRMQVSSGMVDVVRNALSYIKPDWDRAFDFALSRDTEAAIRFLDGRSLIP
jgi:hypothetical protein